MLKVSRSGYYDWCGRGESKRSREDKILLEEIRKVHESNKQAYGAVKTWRALRGWGSSVWEASGGKAQAFSGGSRLVG